MTIVSVVICLILERFLSSLHSIRNYSWLASMAGALKRSSYQESTLKNYLLIMAILLPLPIISALIAIQLKYISSPLEFIFSTIILFYTLGPETFYDRLKEFCQAKQNNDQASARWFVEKIVRRSIDDDEARQLPNTLINNLFPIVNDRIFAPIFWFALLGPFGALLYRGCSRLEYICTSTQPTLLLNNIRTLLSLLNWLPSRLVALGFMMMGNFLNCMHACKIPGSPSFFSFNQVHSNALLSCIGKSAINTPSNPEEINHFHLQAAAALIRRNIELTLGILAIFTLTGIL